MNEEADHSPAGNSTEGERWAGRGSQAIRYRDPVRCNVPAVLLHGSDGHPVGGIVICAGLPHSIGKGSATWHDEEGAIGFQEDGNDSGNPGIEAAPEFHYERVSVLVPRNYRDLGACYFKNI